MEGISLVFWIGMADAFAFQISRAVLIHILKTKYEDIHKALGCPAPIGRDALFVFDISRANSYRIFSAQEKWLVRAMQVMVLIGYAMFAIFICLLAV